MWISRRVMQCRGIDPAQDKLQIQTAIAQVLHIAAADFAQVALFALAMMQT